MTLTWRQALVALKLRWWVVVSVLVVTFGAATAVTMKMPRQYTAETTLLLDLRADPLVATLMPSLAAASYFATQVQILRSDRVAARVVKALGIDKSPTAVDEWREATEGRVTFENYYAGILERGLVVEPVPNSALISIAFTANDPKFAAAVANAYAKAYLDLSVELRVGPVREYATFFDERLKTLKEDLEAAQGRLSAFQQKRGLVVSSERVDQELLRLNALEGTLAQALADSADTSSRQRNAGTDTSVDVSQSLAVQSLRSELGRAETRLSEISATYGSNHPLRIELETRVTELKQQIAAEMRRVSGTTTNVNRIANQRVGELRSLIEAQKRTVLNLRAQRDEASVLLREVETAQRAFDTVAQRRTQLANESQAEQPQARVLSAASEPLTHSKPNIPKNLAAAVIFGLLGGLAVAYLLEMVDRRIRSGEDLSQVEGIPLLAVMSAGRSKHAVPRVPYRRRPGNNAPPQLTMDRAP